MFQTQVLFLISRPLAPASFGVKDLFLRKKYFLFFTLFIINLLCTDKMNHIYCKLQGLMQLENGGGSLPSSSNPSSSPLPQDPAGKGTGAPMLEPAQTKQKHYDLM